MRFSLSCHIALVRLGRGRAGHPQPVDQAAAGFKSMSATIRQVYHIAVINDDTVDTGVMRLKRSGRASTRCCIEITAPDAKSIALEGRKAEIYYPKIKTVQEFDLGKNRGLGGPVPAARFRKLLEGS